MTSIKGSISSDQSLPMWGAGIVLAAVVGAALGWSWLVGVLIVALILLVFVLKNPLYILCAATAAIALGQLGRIPPTATSGGVLISDILIAGLFFVWLIWMIRNRPKLSLQPAQKALVGFLVIIVVGFIFSPVHLSQGDLLVNALYALRFMLYASLLWIVPLLCKTEEQSKTIFRWVLGAGIAVMIIGFFQLMFIGDIGFLSKYGWDPHVGRLVSTFLDPNFLGGYFALMLAMLCALTLNKARPWIWLAAVAMLVAGLLTYSRSGYLAVGTVVVLFGLRYSWKLLLLAVLCIVPLGLAIPRVQSRIAGGFSVDATSQDRIQSWQDALTIGDHYPLLGVGYNNYRQAQESLGLIPPGSTSRSGAGSDSSILNVLATTGVPGLILYLSMFFLVVKDCFRILRSKEKSTAQTVALTLLIALPALFINALFVNALFYPFVAVPLFTLIGLLYVRPASSPNQGKSV
jgi:O-antigen ligase